MRAPSFGRRDLSKSTLECQTHSPFQEEKGLPK
jgi:hypothetical protein